MDKEQILEKIEEILRKNRNAKLNYDDPDKYDSIHESQFPFVAEEILGLHLSLFIPVSEPNIEIIGDAFSDYIKENNLNYSNNDDSFGDAFGLFYAGVEWLLKCQKAKK